ncbi:DUF368 domain-containing protein [Motilimonas cestriensis]|uniref:DUF368 domain-containing protein n=1 Tax=Motilimonas cestriensis TaxID=2742685 RepID=A0ABS8WAP5_9GAMM|nr:DUF368 domain-containing protein [Motilimonas cestriensis]MCE2594844.1 DUF368 domain-containing protein [Motilimonas cestriensis]
MSNKYSTKDWLLLFFKGAGMGAADVVPGVSGGTIAFVTGIYERLLNAIKSVDLKAANILFKNGVKAFWQHIDGTFLLVLFSGLLLSIASLAKLITYLLAYHPLLVWSFFFGLIIASVIHIAKQITVWGAVNITSLIAGSVIAFVITSISPSSVDPAPWFFFVSGAIAICAMILPGISGSFILLLMGMYGHVLAAVNDRDFILLGLFLLGCIVGLMCFSRFLSWLLSRFHEATFALLAGFLVGSLNVLWPWKQVTSTYLSSKGIEKPLTTVNLWPHDFAVATGQDAQTLVCIALMVVGLGLILTIEKLSAPKP